MALNKLQDLNKCSMSIFRAVNVWNLTELYLKYGCYMVLIGRHSEHDEIVGNCLKSLYSKSCFHASFCRWYYEKYSPESLG